MGVGYFAVSFGNWRNSSVIIRSMWTLRHNVSHVFARKGCPYCYPRSVYTARTRDSRKTGLTREGYNGQNGSYLRGEHQNGKNGIGFISFEPPIEESTRERALKIAQIAALSSKYYSIVLEYHRLYYATGD